MILEIKDWIVTLNADDDGHLFVGLRNVDDSKVIQCEADIAGSEQEWADRFTTADIEREYLKENNP